MKYRLIAAMAVLLSLLTGCSNALYDDMPAAIQQFVAQYYPNTQLDTFTPTASSYTVRLKNGPTLTFDEDCHWTLLNGNGATLPTVFLYNELPSSLYDYLEETENTTSVYAAARNSEAYTLTLTDSSLKYTIATGEITGQPINEQQK